MKLFLKRIVPLFYFLAVSLPHHPFSYWLDDVFINRVPHNSVQHFADVASWIVLAIVGALGIRIAIIHRWRAVRHISALIFFLLVMRVADYFLIVNNIERIHYPQYAFLVFLVGLTVRGELLIFSVSTFAGFLDEFLQFVMDPMKVNYLDFNDIVLNTLGSAMGIVILMGLRQSNCSEHQLNPSEGNYQTDNDPNREDKRPSFLSDALRSWRTLQSLFVTDSTADARYERTLRNCLRFVTWSSVASVAIASLLGRIVMLVERKNDRRVLELIDGKLSFILSFERHDEFWMISVFGKTFHVLSLLEAFVVISLLFLGVRIIVVWLRRSRKHMHEAQEKKDQRTEPLGFVDILRKYGVFDVCLTILRKLRLLRPAFKIWERIIAVRSKSPSNLAEYNGLPLPPNDLMVKVAGSADADWFLRFGRSMFKIIVEMLQKHDVRLESSGAVLEFGCGCGRVLRHWQTVEGAQIHGVDCDKRLIRWCQENLPFARSVTNDISPPLPYERGLFHFVYAISVFTHMSEKLQISWMHELRRVIRPGGYLLITTHGQSYFNQLSVREQEDFAAGRLVVRYAEASGLNFCGAFHPETFVRQQLASGYTIIEFVPAGTLEPLFQDLYLLRKE